MNITVVSIYLSAVPVLDRMVKKHPLETELQLDEGAVHLVYKVENRFERATPTAYWPTTVGLHCYLIEESVK